MAAFATGVAIGRSSAKLPFNAIPGARTIGAGPEHLPPPTLILSHPLAGRQLLAQSTIGRVSSKDRLGIYSNMALRRTSMTRNPELCTTRLALLFESEETFERSFPEGEACPCPERKTSAAHRIEFRTRADGGVCMERGFDCVADTEWPRLYQGVANVDLRLSRGGQGKPRDRVLFPETDRRNLACLSFPPLREGGGMPPEIWLQTKRTEPAVQGLGGKGKNAPGPNIVGNNGHLPESAKRAALSQSFFRSGRIEAGLTFPAIYASPVIWPFGSSREPLSNSHSSAPKEAPAHFANKGTGRSQNA
jgi:hypothetical protein